MARRRTLTSGDHQLGKALKANRAPHNTKDAEMTAITAGNHRHRPLRPIANLALATAALTVGVVAAISDSPASEGTVAPQAQTPASAQQADNADLADIPYVSPINRDATGDSNRGRWRYDVPSMPPGWPATQVVWHRR